MEYKLSKQVYYFEKVFKYFTGELNNIEENINIQIDLTIDLEGKRFWLDFNSPFNTEVGILLMYGHNLVGNIYRKVKATAEFYRWVAEICDFADKELNKDNDQYDILKDEKVIDIAAKFAYHINNNYPEDENDNMFTTEMLRRRFTEFVASVYGPTKRFPKKGKRNYDNEKHSPNEDK